jgi:hypothetical protein
MKLASGRPAMMPWERSATVSSTKPGADLVAAIACRVEVEEDLGRRPAPDTDGLNT